jgi:hypothetical protein
MGPAVRPRLPLQAAVASRVQGRSAENVAASACPDPVGDFRRRFLIFLQLSFLLDSQEYWFDELTA